MSEIKLKAYAKLNLSLDVCGRREDGYHDVDMIMASCSLCDEITIKKDKNLTLEVDCEELSCGEDNLMIKAARAFFDFAKISGGAQMTLSKRIPIAAGMAGGSTDAAAVLKGLNALYEAKLTADELCKIGVKLGADIPYCITGGVMRAQGIGEKLSYIGEIKNAYVVIVKGEKSLSTADIYRSIDAEDSVVRPDNQLLIQYIKNGDIKSLAENMKNVMEQVSIKEIPEIEGVKKKLVTGGALGSVMSGSGPTVFGIFDDKNTAEAAAKMFSDKYFVFCGEII